MSSSGTVKKGGAWKGGVSVELKDIGESDYMDFDDLIEKLEGRADLSASITEISTYTTPLSERQLTHFLLYHKFVVFKAGGKWWSLEMDADRITIQRGDTQSSVKDYIRGDRRLKGTYWTVKQHRSGTGTKTVLECMQALDEMKDVTSTYHYLTNNSQGNAKKGGNWKGGVYVELTDITWSTCMDFDELIEQLEGRADLSAGITEISTYTTPLKEWQLTDFFFFHEFVVFKAGGKWWSVEKDSQQIIIQRGDTQSIVTDYIRGDKRLEGTSWVVKQFRSGTDTGPTGRNVLHCMQALEHTSRITSSYHYITNNCQSFAYRLFKYLNGGAWTCGVHVELKDIRRPIITCCGNLIKQLERCADLEARITKIANYTGSYGDSALASAILISLVGYIVFEAGGKWWSVEMLYNRMIIIQRGDTQSSVKDYILGGKRVEVRQLMSGTGTKTVGQCMQALDQMKDTLFERSTAGLKYLSRRYARKLFTYLTE